jgi:hypothetical protein
LLGRDSEADEVTTVVVIEVPRRCWLDIASMLQDDPGAHDLLHITKALLGRATWPNSTRMLITEPSRGRILPLGMPFTGRMLICLAFESSI